MSDALGCGIGETPADFVTSKQVDGFAIELHDAHELGMGGPVVGRLVINGERLRGTYGGPFHIVDGSLYIPVLKWKLFTGRYFDLATIDLCTKRITFGGMRQIVLGVLSSEGDDLILTGDIAARWSFKKCVFKT